MLENAQQILLCFPGIFEEWNTNDRNPQNEAKKWRNLFQLLYSNTWQINESLHVRMEYPNGNFMAFCPKPFDFPI